MERERNERKERKEGKEGRKERKEGKERKERNKNVQSKESQTGRDRYGTVRSLTGPERQEAREVPRHTDGPERECICDVTGPRPSALPGPVHGHRPPSLFPEPSILQRPVIPFALPARPVPFRPSVTSHSPEPSALPGACCLSCPTRPSLLPDLSVPSARHIPCPTFSHDPSPTPFRVTFLPLDPSVPSVPPFLSRHSTFPPAFPMPSRHDLSFPPLPVLP
ncbi:hypothetical protein PBY51_004609 [Eleginops maclovinus]|uniref:Uncharacterized protein n=1 Tax=Eleginops maclovinus TaxID=56733 RepID=A0AAN8AX98_ELEMC|nr:hypothetical protein PBY51_004609 [Eleginops maclovinus]